MGIAAPRTDNDRQLVETFDAGWSAAIQYAIEIGEKWSGADHIRLHAGEMTAQELRSVRAVVRAIVAELREP